MGYEQLKGGKYYHIYNRGNGPCDLFRKPQDYEHFLSLYDRYILPVAETCAWVLMPNHFHLLVKIREHIAYKHSPPEEEEKMEWFNEHKWETIDLSNLTTSEGFDNIKTEGFDNIRSRKKPVPHRHFAHLFNAYSHYLNICTGRTGNLFQRPFKRKEVSNRGYLKQLVMYIHNNPVHHGFCSHPLEYPWSSYPSDLSNLSTSEGFDNIKTEGFDNIRFEKQHIQHLTTDLSPDLSPDLSTFEELDNIIRIKTKGESE